MLSGVVGSWHVDPRPQLREAGPVRRGHGRRRQASAPSSSRPRTGSGSRASPSRSSRWRSWPSGSTCFSTRRCGAAGGDAAIPGRRADRSSDDGRPLDQPIVEEFRVGTITLSWDAEDGRRRHRAVPGRRMSRPPRTFDEEADDGARRETRRGLELEADEVVVVKLDPGYARSFVRRAQSVVSAGRPPCQFCGSPLDPEGHLCPRANGFKRIARLTRRRLSTTPRSRRS